jgi:hypothetical protein
MAVKKRKISPRTTKNGRAKYISYSNNQLQEEIEKSVKPRIKDKILSILASRN